MSRLILLAPFLLAASSQPSGAANAARVRAVLQPEATVSGPQITLGALGSITGDEALAARVKAVVVGQAPLAGFDRDIDVDYIRIRLRQNHIDPDQVEFAAPPRVKVRSAGRVLTADDLIARAEAEVRRVESASGAEVAVEAITRPLSLVVPEGNVEVKAELPPSAVRVGNIRVVHLAVLAGGTQVGATTVTLRVRTLRPVWVAARPLAANAVLAEGDARIEKRDVAGLERALPADQPVVGLRARRAVNAGGVLTTAALCAAPDVRQGDAVQATLSAGPIRIRMETKALEEGAVGEEIRVLNSRTGREHRVRITGQGTAVLLEAP